MNRLYNGIMNDHRTMADATAVILTGGKSSRMGRPKALLPFDGEPLITHVVRALKKMFAEAVVVAAPEQELPILPVVLVRDEVAYQGPVSGIYHGLSASSQEICFVTSCDAPFLNLQLIAHLLAQISDCDVVVPLLAGAISAFACGLPAQRRTASAPTARPRRATSDFAVRKSSNSRNSPR